MRLTLQLTGIFSSLITILQCDHVFIIFTIIFCYTRFPFAREMKRKIIFHAGPTNSGKTHTAIERFQEADTGLYCGPLRLLATEVFRRTNNAVSKVVHIRKHMHFYIK